MASDVTVYVDPDATGGGTGADWTNAYTSLNAAQTAKAKDLTSSDERYIFLCRSSGGTADTVQVQWSNTWTCNYGAGQYILVQAYTGHRAVKTGWNNSIYRISVTDGRALYIAEYGAGAHAIVYDGIQMERIYSATTYQPCVHVAACASGTVVILQNCRIRSNNATLNGIQIADADCTFRMWNTIGEGVYNNYFYVSGGTCYLWNSVLRGTGTTGYAVGASGVCDIINAVVTGTWTNQFNFAGSGSVDHCGSDVGYGTNPISPSGGDWDNEYVDSTNGNWTLINTGNCYHGGADNPSSGMYTTDIEGYNYNSGAYSVGVDEYPVSGISIPVVIHHRQQQKVS